MSFIYQQIELDVEGQSRVSAYMIIHQIIMRLRDYSDNGPIEVDGPVRFVPLVKSKRGHEMGAVLEKLAKHNIIMYKQAENSTALLHRVFVTNRYRLELLHAELKWLGEPEDKRSEAPHVDNLVYYNPLSGRGSVNGKSIYLNKSKRNNKVKAKEIFDLLFANAPNPVPRRKIADKLGLDKYAPEESDRITQALSNLRRRCGVTKNVIYMQQKSGVLNAIVVPIDELPDFFNFPE